MLKSEDPDIVTTSGPPGDYSCYIPANMAQESLSQRLKSQAKDMHEYQQLKLADDMGREATARYKEKLIKKYGHPAAEALMRRKGYDPDLLR
jgi:hypothetical protein